MVRHIGFAERWLERAKREVAEGYLARSLLTLLLTEAEVHHAREASFPSPQSAVLPRPSTVPAILGATGLAAALLICALGLPTKRAARIADCYDVGWAEAHMVA